MLIKTETGESFSPKELQESDMPLAHATTIPDPQFKSDEVEQGTSTASQQVDRIFKIACIDNGLAFPFKHPSDIRSYPFSWSKYFPYFANQPFVPEVKECVLRVLQNVELIKQLCIKVQSQLNVSFH